MMKLAVARWRDTLEWLYPAERMEIRAESVQLYIASLEEELWHRFEADAPAMDWIETFLRPSSSPGSVRVL